MTTTVETLTSHQTRTTNSNITMCEDNNDTLDELPETTPRSMDHTTNPTATTKRPKHSKKLSLNFPILIPGANDSPRNLNGSASTWSQSPTVASPYRASTPASGLPFPSPEELTDAHHLAEGPDFLTLIAGQERRVMELKEELSKAENVLLGLKRQWAIYEAKKKQSELRSKTVKLGPVSPKSATTLAADEEADRAKRREAREQKMRELGIAEGDVGRSNSTSGRKNGGRVFVGRHTRTLSLLQSNGVSPDAPSSTNRPKSRTESSPAVTQHGENFAPSTPASEHVDDEEDRKSKRYSLSRQPTLQELIASSATGAAQMNFGKTYKDLAQASRKSLPPGTDIFVKQGKQVYDGVSQGFWNFVEDIRQATVGDEPVNGVPVEQRREVKRTKSSKKLDENSSCDKHAKGGRSDAAKRHRNGDQHKPEKDSFWNEFGIETPKNPQKGERTASRKTSSGNGRESTASMKDHESKSSTDSKCPPSLLVDLMDVNEDDEAWDNWPVDSPANKRRAERHIEIRRGSEDEDHDSMPIEPTNSERHFTARNHKSIETSWTELIA